MPGTRIGLHRPEQSLHRPEQKAPQSTTVEGTEEHLRGTTSRSVGLQGNIAQCFQSDNGTLVAKRIGAARVAGRSAEPGDRRKRLKAKPAPATVSKGHRLIKNGFRLDGNKNRRFSLRRRRPRPAGGSGAVDGRELVDRDGSSRWTLGQRFSGCRMVGTDLVGPSQSFRISFRISLRCDALTFETLSSSRTLTTARRHSSIAC